MDVDFVAGRVRRLESLQAVAGVRAVGSEDVIDHRLRPWRPVYDERLVTLERPRREDEVGQAECVVRMEVREKQDAELTRLERLHPVTAGCRRGPPHDAGAGVDEVRGASADNGDRWAGTLRV